MGKLSTPENISTKRTAVNITVVGYVIYALNRILGWDINLTDTDMLIIMPVVGVVFGIGYRLSRAITTRWPQIGWLLFGSGQEPQGLKKIGE